MNSDNKKITKRMMSIFIAALVALSLLLIFFACSGIENSSQSFKIEGKWKSVGD